jgi:hypothetical protein
MSEQDLSNTWYSKAEYNAFETSRRNSIAALRKLKSEEETLVGLEDQLTTQQTLTRKMRASQYTRLVVKQQHSVDTCLFAMLKLFTRQASQRAQLRAWELHHER